MSSETARRPFAELFGGRPGDSDMARIARAAAKAGYAVLPIAPGQKTPLCPLTPRQAAAADKEAAHAARDAGRASWERVRHPCGIAHATTDPKVAHRWFKRLAQEHPDLNLGVSVGASRALVADADTLAELASFTTLWARKEDNEELIRAAPTVRSPGERDEHGVWKHSEGGHYWFLLPDDPDDPVEFGDLAGVTSIPIGTDPEHPAQLKVSGYVLVPPSVRAEGPYVMASDANVAPDWLIELVIDHVAHRRETRAERRDRALDADDQIRLAQSAVAWSAILAPRGWMDTGKSSRCGCPEWTAPGDHGSPKSATAHDPGCGEFDTTDGFIHVWTDNPPGDLGQAGTKTFSKIQLVAWHDHGGDMGAAMADLDIERVIGGQPTVLDRARVAELLAKSQNGTAPAQEPENDCPRCAHRVVPGCPDCRPSADSDDEEDDDDEPEDIDPVDALIAELIPASELDKIPPPVPLVDGLLDRNSLARVIGKAGHGKSFFMIDISGHVALGQPWHGRPCAQGDVVYMVAEGATGMHKRVRAWERHHGVELGERVQFLPRPVQVKDHEWLVWIAAMAKLKPALIIIDTQARVTVGANENGPEDMGVLVHRADLLRQQTGACVVLVHHKGHQGDHGRGHTMVIGALDAEIEVTKEAKNKIAIMSSKQKDQEDFDPIRLELVKVQYGMGVKENSGVLVEPGSDAAAGEPFETTPVVDEKSSARDRVAALLYRTFKGGSGTTPSKLWGLIFKNDRGPNGKPMSERTFWRAWSQLEAEGVLVKNGSKYLLSIEEADRLGLCDDD